MKNADIFFFNFFFRSNEFFNEDSLRKELEHYKNQDMPDRSIDYHLENTDDFVSWANKKRKGTNLDPENRKPTQVSCIYISLSLKIPTCLTSNNSNPK